MRKLQTQDVFNAVRVIKKAELKEDLKLVLTKEETNINNVGFEVLFTIMEKAETAESAIYEFLAGPLECKAKEVKEMELLTLIEQLKKVADVDGWKSFFKGVSALTK